MTLPCPGPAYDVSMVWTFTVEIWEDPNVLLYTTMKGYDVSDIMAELRVIKEAWKGPGRILRVTRPYYAVTERIPLYLPKV